MSKIFSLFFIISSAHLLFSQDTLHSRGQEVIETILGNASDEQDMQNYGDELEYFEDHPINIQKPNYSELIRLPFVSPLLAESIILYTDTVTIVSVEQLNGVSLMTPILYEQLLPFITIDNSIINSIGFNSMPLKIQSRSRLERRLQTLVGFRQNKYRGDPNGSYQRLKIANNNIELAGLVEKDAGESYSDGLSAGSLAIKNISVLKNLIFGNYNISAGQGLVMAKNITSSKGMDAIGQIRKRGSVVSPSVSTDEFRYFSGSAVQFLFQNITLTSFYSERHLPASIDDDGVATSFYTSGIYRTTTELQKRYSLKEKVAGGKIDLSFDDRKTISFNVITADYDKPLASSLFDLSGKKSITAGSVSWELPISDIFVFGEAASNDADRFSKVLGIIVPIERSFTFCYHHRAYTKGYTSPFSRPFGERENIADGELGNYLGIKIQNENTIINSYVDYYILPSTSNGFGSVGTDMLMNIQHSISPKMDFIFQIRNKIRSQIEVRFEDDERTQTNYRIAYTFKATSHFSLSQRFEFVKIFYNPSQYTEEGFLTFIEGKYRNSKNGLSLKSRCIFFDTHSYDSRLYQYESDVAGNFANPPIYGKGIRWYIVAGYEFIEGFQFSLKYSETKKLDEVVLGSGDDEIQGNLDNQIAVQLDFKF